MSEPTPAPIHCFHVAPWITEALERMYREYLDARELSDFPQRPTTSDTPDLSSLTRRDEWGRDE